MCKVFLSFQPLYVFFQWQARRTCQTDEKRVHVLFKRKEQKLKNIIFHVQFFQRLVSKLNIITFDLPTEL